MRHRALFSSFDHHQGHSFGQARHGFVEIIGLGDQLRLARIRQKHINVAKNILQSTFPLIVWIVVGIQRNCEALRFQSPKQFPNMGPETTLQIIG